MLYRVGLADASDADKPPTCLSCDIELCEYVSASFSGTTEFYILGCLGPDIPSFRLRKVNGSQPGRCCLHVGWLGSNIPSVWWFVL